MFIMSTYPDLQLQLLREISFVAASKHTFSGCGASFFSIDRKHFAFATTSPWCLDTLNLCKYPCTKKNGSLAVLTFAWVFPHQNTTVTGLLARGREYFCIRMQPSFRVACQKGRSLGLEAVRCGVVCSVNLSSTPNCSSLSVNSLLRSASQTIIFKWWRHFDDVVLNLRLRP